MAYPFQIGSFEEYKEVYRQSIDEPEVFWAGVAEHFTWRKRWDKVLDWNFEEPRVRWFEGAQLNITENCLDRHLKERADVPAIIWEPNDPKEEGRTLTYQQLYDEVCAFAHFLHAQGVGKGDRVCLYMGMIPELAVAVLACARLGAVHSVIFGGFSAQSIADRLQDSSAEYIITCDGAYRGAKDIPLKNVVDDALLACPFVKRVIVCNRTHTPCSMIKGRDVWWPGHAHYTTENLEHKDFPAQVMEAEDPLFILYTSGSTGKPKGVVHSIAGYMLYTTYTFVNVFQYQPGDVHFCTADIGWITGHSYILYGPLCAGATTLLFEGIPTWPDAGRFWDIVQKHRVNILYTAPTAIRSLMSFGLEPLQGKDLSSLKVLGTVGEPINEEAWWWYHDHVGGKRCPVVDTWWQTETGGIMISNLAGITPSKPAHATLPMPGVKLQLVTAPPPPKGRISNTQPSPVNESDRSLESSESELQSEASANPPLGSRGAGNLCITQPWPSIIRTTWGDHERCRQAYFSTYKNLYFTGDGALRDEDGMYRITGRVDDVLNVSGHRIGTAEVENAINRHTGVVESAVVGYPHDIKGQGIYAYVIMTDFEGDQEGVKKDIGQTVNKLIGPIARPDKIQLVKGLPKTRSGKIMRRILRKIAEGETSNLGDTSTLLDPSVVIEIVENKL